MLKYFTFIAFLFISILSGQAQQDINDFQGNWEGVLPNAEALNFDIVIEDLQLDTYNLVISNYKTSINKKLVSSDGNRIKFSLDENTHFNFAYKNDGATIDGFISSGVLLYHISLKKVREGAYQGTWNPFMVNQLQSQAVYLSVENNDDGSFAIYPFFGDQRFTGTWVGGFERENDIVYFRDHKTGLNFKATLLENKIQLEILLSARTMTVTNLVRSNVDLSAIPAVDQIQKIKLPELLEDGWMTASMSEFNINPAPLNTMVDAINAKELVNTHSVLVAKKGKLIFEGYFEGYNAHVVHDQRSASKSISSAMIGIAIEDGWMEGVEQKLYDFLPQEFQQTQDASKKSIRIQDLLTMSSGIDAVDFGIEGNSAASEDNYQNSDDWLKTVLEAPMIHEPGTHANYGSANPYLLGVSLDSALETPLDLYMDEKLFAPLGIINYIIQTDNSASTPYFGGGMYLTPRDMLKFGQLYLQKGKWKGTQVISEDFVNDSFKKYRVIENADDKNQYGYMWWHKTYTVENRSIESIEARGAGGQTIFVIPALEVVAVITSGNYRNGKYQQPELILEKYILPALLN